MAKIRGDAKDVFTPDQIEEFRGALLQERESIVRQIRSLSSASLTSSRQAGEELADVGSDDFIRETELHLMTEESNNLAQINAALESIAAGSYGICVDCAKAISVGRLRAKPYARRCIDCKTAREENGDGFLDEDLDDEDVLAEE
ncbi:MAG: TraR/DksA C4-type zinc finger protein [Lentisphaeria bacterium]|nr:TraR/DksA C4-type zinc finger protein [Lentisphaeria bacterium]